MPSPLRRTGRHSNAHHWPTTMGRAAAMVYSYTQISQYLRCPRSYRYRYLDGWREKETRAAMVFGRCFEKALGAYFCQEDSAAVLSKNGMRTVMPLLNSAKENPGTASSTKESICSKHLHGIVAYGFAVRNRICKSKCCRHCRAEVSSFPILMPSGRSMTSTALSTGRRQPAVIQRNPRDCSHSTRNSFVIPGSA